MTSFTDRAGGSGTTFNLLLVVLTLGSGLLAAPSALAASGATNRSIEHGDEVQLRPPLLRNGGDTHLALCFGLLLHQAQDRKTFLLPKFESVAMLVVGDSTLRYEFRTPGGRRFVPGETPEQDGFKSGGMKGFEILYFEHPEPGVWSVTIDASAARDSAMYAIDVSTHGSVEEQPHLETFSRDSHPFSSTVRPGSLVYVRAFVLRRDRPVPGVAWKVHVLTSEDSLRVIRVFDDGRHADGSANDGIYVGSIQAEGPDGLYRFTAEAQTPEGVRYAEASTLEVQAKYDLLVASEIAVSSDPRVGRPVMLTVTVKNDGARDYQQVKLGLDVTLTEGPNRGRWEEEISRQTFDLRAGESRRVPVRWMPFEAGEYEVQLAIDPYLEPYEIDYGNNRKTTMVRVQPRARSPGVSPR